MFKIDEYEVVVNRNFRENAFTVPSLLKNTIVKMVFAHSYQSDIVYNFRYYIIIKLTRIRFGNNMG